MLTGQEEALRLVSRVFSTEGESDGLTCCTLKNLKEELDIQDKSYPLSFNLFTLLGIVSAI